LGSVKPHDGVTALPPSPSSFRELFTSVFFFDHPDFLRFLQFVFPPPVPVKPAVFSLADFVFALPLSRSHPPRSAATIPFPSSLIEIRAYLLFSFLPHCPQFAFFSPGFLTPHSPFSTVGHDPNPSGQPGFFFPPPPLNSGRFFLRSGVSHSLCLLALSKVDYSYTSYATP